MQVKKQQLELHMEQWAGSNSSAGVTAVGPSGHPLRLSA